MTIFGVTPLGFVIKPIGVIRQEVADYQLANVDPGLDQDPRDPLQQINESHVAQLSELWQLAQASYAALYPDSANDTSLTNVASITGTTRSGSSKTKIPGVLVTLDPNVALPVDSVANLTSQPNARFLSDVEVPANPAGGTFAVGFTAESDGATVVAPGQLSEIAQPVAGWTLVTNPVAGVTGTETETDADLRVKRSIELLASGSTNVDAIRADLIKLATVVDARVFQNDKDTQDAFGRPGHVVHAVLRGGVAATVAEQLFKSTAGGIGFFGAQSEVVLDSTGTAHVVKFDNATELVFFADITVVVDPLIFDATLGPGAIKAAISAYVNALEIGDDVIFDVVKAAVLPVPGVPDCGVVGVLSISSLLIGFGVADQGIDLPVSVTQFASSDVANIAVAVTP